MSASPTVAVVIVNYRTPDLALRALDAVAGERAALPGLCAALVDGGSGDGSAEVLAQALAHPRFAGWATFLPLAINGGFGWANNQAMQRLLQAADPPDFLHILNPDTIVEPGAIARLAEVLAAHPRCAVAGSLLLEEDGTPAGSAFAFASIRAELVRGSRIGALARLLRVPPTALPPGAPAQEVDWVTGASAMFRATALREVGLFDTGFFLYFEEVELMTRIARAGWSIRFVPESRVAHVGGAATGVNRSLVVTERPPLPPYWYASRRRMLGLSFGRLRASVAGLAWIGGHSLFLLRHALGGARTAVLTRDEGRGFLRHGLLARAPDIMPAATAWDEVPGRPPRWMPGQESRSDARADRR